jgi:hypothetical protein
MDSFWVEIRVLDVFRPLPYFLNTLPDKFIQWLIVLSIHAWEKDLTVYRLVLSRFLKEIREIIAFISLSSFMFMLMMRGFWFRLETLVGFEGFFHGLIEIAAVPRFLWEILVFLEGAESLVKLIWDVLSLTSLVLLFVSLDDLRFAGLMDFRLLFASHCLGSFSFRWSWAVLCVRGSVGKLLFEFARLLWLWSRVKVNAFMLMILLLMLGSHHVQVLTAESKDGGLNRSSDYSVVLRSRSFDLTQDV